MKNIACWTHPRRPQSPSVSCSFYVAKNVLSDLTDHPRNHFIEISNRTNQCCLKAAHVKKCALLSHGDAGGHHGHYISTHIPSFQPQLNLKTGHCTIPTFLTVSVVAAGAHSVIQLWFKACTSVSLTTDVTLQAKRRSFHSGSLNMGVVYERVSSLFRAHVTRSIFVFY